MNHHLTPLASLRRRLLAVAIDALILFIPCAILSHIIPIIGGIIVLFLYAPVLESSTIQATIGKNLVGIQVTDLQNNRISFRMALIRNIVKFFSSLLLFLGHFFAFFNTKKQALHDLLAETIVIYGRSNDSIIDSWWKEAKTLFGQIQTHSNLGDTDISKLERLHTLRNQGALTEEEFQNEKRKILNKEL